MWLRIAYDLGMMHGTIQDICVKTFVDWLKIVLYLITYGCVRELRICS